MIRWSDKLVYDPLIKWWSDSVKTGIETNKTKIAYSVVTLPGDGCICTERCL